MKIINSGNTSKYNDENTFKESNQAKAGFNQFQSLKSQKNQLNLSQNYNQ